MAPCNGLRSGGNGISTGEKYAVRTMLDRLGGIEMLGEGITIDVCYIREMGPESMLGIL